MSVLDRPEPAPAEPATSAPDAARSGPPAAPAGTRPRRRWVRWLLAVALVTGLIIVVTVLFSGAARTTLSDDARSSLPDGSGALAQLLRDEGIQVLPTSEPAEAEQWSTAGTTLVVAQAQNLTDGQARALARAPHARLVLLRPTLLGLQSFGVAASTTAGSSGPVEPECGAPEAGRAGVTSLADRRAFYRSSATPLLACYPSGDGFGWLRVPGAAGPVDLLAGGTANRVLDSDGNAALAMNVLGSQTRLVWLNAAPQDEGDAGPDGRAGQPGLLPPWWTLAMLQAGLAFAVVAVWRGRRLGPIMTEPLPVRVRSAETVEGHGRLYFRISARDRTAQTLRRGARRRLARRFGHGGDPEQLAAAVADRIGAPYEQVLRLLSGPVPEDDHALLALARDLQSLEAATRRPGSAEPPTA